MNYFLKVSVVFVITSALANTAHAQRTHTKPSTSETKTSDTSSADPKTKAQKIMSDMDDYSKMAGDVKTKFKNLFPAKAGDTLYFVIPGISYTDANLKLFKQNLEQVKSTKGLVSSYKNNAAVIKVLYKGGDVSTLYDKLDDATKALFIPEDIEGNRAILNYKLANYEAADKIATKQNP